MARVKPVRPSAAQPPVRIDRRHGGGALAERRSAPVIVLPDLRVLIYAMSAEMAPAGLGYPKARERRREVALDEHGVPDLGSLR